MKKGYMLIVFLFLIFSLSRPLFAASNYYMGTDVIAPNYGAGIPAKGGSVTDATTGATLTRITDIIELTPDLPADASVVYSRFSPTNTSGEYLLVHGSDSTSCWVVRLSDNAVICKLARNGIGAEIGELNEIRWDYSGNYPTRVYFVFGMVFYQMDVLTENGNPTPVHDFSADYPTGALIRNDVEGDSSNDSRYWAWQVYGPYDGANYPRIAFITYDKQTDTILGSLVPGDVVPTQNAANWTDKFPKPNMVEIAPGGTKVITHYSRTYPGSPTADFGGTYFDGAYAWNLDFSGTPVRVSVTETHSGWAFAEDGSDVFVSQDNTRDKIQACYIDGRGGAYPANCFDIMDHTDLGFYPGLHFGKFYDNSLRGWFHLNTYSAASSVHWGYDQLLMVELKPATDNPKVWRITPNFNEYAGNYRDEATAALGYDGKSIYWTANWGDAADGHGEVLEVKLPSNWYSYFGGEEVDLSHSDAEVEPSVSDDESSSPITPPSLLRVIDND